MKRFSHSKKGFDVNQMFIFVTAVVVIGFVVLFGAKAIGGFNNDNEDLIEPLVFKTDLEQLISVVKNDHGSQKIFEAKLPSKYQYMCLFDIKSSVDNEECPDELKALSPRLCDLIWARNKEVGAQQNNIVFIRPDKSTSDPQYVQGIRIEDHGVGADGFDETFLCTDARVVELKLRSERQEVFISELG